MLKDDSSDVDVCIDEEDDGEKDHIEERTHNSGSEQNISDTQQEPPRPVSDGLFLLGKTEALIGKRCPTTKPYDRSSKFS